MFASNEKKVSYRHRRQAALGVKVF